MSLQNGEYQIFSANPEAGHLDLDPSHGATEARIYFVVGSHRKDLKEQWRLTSVGGNKYTIHSTTHPRAGWTLRDNIVVVSEGHADEFSIEHAGEGSYKIHVPNENLVATLDKAGDEKLRVAPADGSDSQRWMFSRRDM